KAAEQGLPAAQYDYAVMLLQGRGLLADENKAISYLTAAAENGVPGAQNRLGHVYVEGAGVEANPIEAAKWRLIAKGNGVVDDKLDLFVAALTDADRAKAQAAANDWREKKQLVAH
ncbi:MAG: tetratricopeptide repeat protein, partial [Hyphomicrobium sp.]